MPSFKRKIAVPLPIDGEHPAARDLPMRADGLRSLCTRRCLAMERLRGRSLLAAQRESQLGLTVVNSEAASGASLCLDALEVRTGTKEWSSCRSNRLSSGTHRAPPRFLL